MKTEAKKELDRITPVMKQIKTSPGLSEEQKRTAKEFLEMIQAYYQDGLHFFEKQKYLESFECFVYTWGWLDAGARIGLFEIPKELRKSFKIEQ